MRELSKQIAGLCFFFYLSSTGAQAVNEFKPEGASGTVGGCSDEFTENLAYDDRRAQTTESEEYRHEEEV